MTVTFVETELLDLTYELNDGELVNDVLCIVGEPDLEVLVRGYDATSIAKYGRRSYRIDNPIVANELNPTTFDTPKEQVTAILDRNIEPYALVEITLVNTSAALTIKILNLEISDLVQITESTCGLAAVYFIVESIDLTIDPIGYITGRIGLVEARAGEQP